MRTNYPSDITREQFENVRKDLKGVKKRILENMMFKISFVQYYIHYPQLKVSDFWNTIFIFSNKKQNQI